MAKMLLMMEFDFFFSDLSSDRHLSGICCAGCDVVIIILWGVFMNLRQESKQGRLTSMCKKAGGK